MSRAALGWGAIAACLALTVWASSGASDVLSRLLRYVPGGDVTGHFLIMGALAAACVLAFARGQTGARGAENSGLWRQRLTAQRVMALVALGVTADEFIQILIPSRTFSWLDLAASLAGVAAFGGLAAWALVKRNAASGG